MSLVVTLLLGALMLGAVVLAARYWGLVSWQRSLSAFVLTLPSETTPEEIGAWLASLAALTHAPRGSAVPSPPVCLESTATALGIEHRLLVPKSLVDAVLAGMRAALPAARIVAEELRPLSRAKHTAAAELMLRGDRRQLAVERAAAASLAQVAGLQPLRRGEAITWQWIFTSAGTPPPIVGTASTSVGGLPWWLEGQAPADADEVRSARLKQREPLLHASGRLVVRAATRARCWELFGRTWGPVRLLNVPGARLVRSLLPSPFVGSQADRRVWPLLRWRLRLNSAELAGLLAIPLSPVPLPGLPASLTRQVPPPHELAQTGTVLADSSYPGFDRPLALKRRDRLTHVALLGPTGTGKSSLMISMALQDIDHGDGLAVLDPKADMASDLLARIPAARYKDVIVVNPADTDRPVGFNVLATNGSESERELAVDHVLHVFHEQWKEFWGPRTDAVLRASLLVLASARAADGSAFTVCELPALLTDTAFRQWVTVRPGVPESVHDFFFWFEALSNGERTQVVGPVLNKLTALTQRTPIRLILGQSEGLDLRDVMQSRKLLIMPLSRGLVGAETAQLLSSLMLSSLWQATLARVRIPADKRRPYWLYIDEAAEVVRLPLELADLMSEARGLGLGLTLATQYLAQLPTETRKALLSTVRSTIAFQTEVDDAKLLARAYEPSLTADDLRNLPAYEVAMRLAIDGRTSRPMTGKTRPLPDPIGDTAAAELRARSRIRFGTPRADVEVALRSRLQVPAGARPPVGKRPRSSGGRP